MVDGQWGQETEWLRLARMGDTTAYAELRSRWRFVTRLPEPDEGSSATGSRALTCATRWPSCPTGTGWRSSSTFYLDLPLEEVSAVLGLGIAGVKARINRGLRRLRLALEAEQR
jgi:hypothetical protein